MKKTKKIIAGLFTIIFMSAFIVGCSKTTTNNGGEVTTDKPKNVQQDNSDSKDVETKIDKTGVLLGLARDNSTGLEQFFSTYWITREGNDVVFKSKENEIIAPYENAFWTIQKNEFKEDKLNSFVEEKENYSLMDYDYKAKAITLTSHPINSENKPYITKDNFFEKLKLDSFPYNETNEKLLYVGNRYVAAFKDGSYRSGGTMNMTEYENNIYELPELNNKTKNINLFKASAAEMGKLKEEYNVVVGEEKYDNGEPFVKVVKEIDDKNISIKHIEGKWKAVVPFSEFYEHYGNGSSHSSLIKYIPLKLELEKDIVGHNELAMDWDTIKEKLPEAIDAISSPQEDMLVVLTKDRILIYLDPVKKGLEKAKATIELKENQNIIMEQWTSDEKVDEWNEKLKGTLK